MNKEKLLCLKPIINNDCEILILGSIPSIKSRQCNFYYSNPTNRFWKILSSIFNEDFVNINNDLKTKLLLSHHIAIFDIYSSCEMKKESSSLDSNIINQKFNDIPNLVKGTNITKIYITSKKAYKEFIKRFGDIFELLKIKIISLPSPSSANRREYKTDDDIIKVWKELILIS